jgi:hypothetical protein
VSADVWSATSWTELRRDALACESWNMLHPSEPPRVPYVTSALADTAGPVVAVSDWIKAVPDQIARWVPGTVHLAGHRRVRLLRHPPGRPAVLPRGRRVDHGRRALGAGSFRRGGRGLPGPGDHPVPLDLPVSEALS